MKKNNEGYVMIYVLVVMVLLALVATGVLGVSLNNYKAQQAVGQQMQELYTAEGAAEQAVAEIGVQSGDLVLGCQHLGPDARRYHRILTGIDPCPGTEYAHCGSGKTG